MIKKTLCFSKRAYLSLHLGQLVIELPGDEESPPVKTTRPIEDIGVIIVESHFVTLTSALISALLDNNVAVVTCDERHMPSGLLLPLAGNTLQSERFRDQIESSLPLRKQLWQQTVAAKIANQGAVLKRWNSKECECMRVWSENVRSNDSENLEGRAAAFYWRNIFEENPDFTRERDADGPNALFNYGYAILRAIIARSLIGSGLMPTLGIHHRNKYNAYCLADDIMEPYRPYVDMMVMEIIKANGEAPPLSPEIKRILLTLPTIDVRIGNVTRPLMVAATMTTASLAKCFSGESRKISYPLMDWDYHWPE